MKLRERFVIGASVSVVLFTLALVVDLQLDLGMSGQHLAPSHGRLRYAANPQQYVIGKYPPKKEETVGGSTLTEQESVAVLEEHDGFEDLEAILRKKDLDDASKEVIGRNRQGWEDEQNKLTFKEVYHLEAKSGDPRFG
ncbi:hypothetical protein J6590_016153 [Homalodisca vitripennis]|nr:hypothetical protein J6590_016153 [Homalodisca vitripennis]